MTEITNEMIATEVMGWSCDNIDDYDTWRDEKYENTGYDVRDWEPLKSITDAFRVVDRMEELGWDIFSIEHNTDPLITEWVARFDSWKKRGHVVEYAVTKEQAICRAALNAVIAKGE